MNDVTLDQILSQRLDANKNIVNVDEAEIKLVIFELSQQYFAFHGDRILEILAQAEVFFVPGCPSSLEGVINVRGDIESVIRPHALLNLPTAGSPLTQSSILLGRGSTMSSGIRVDRVLDVVDVPHSSIRPPPATLPEHLRALVLGVLQFQKQQVVVLDLEKMFADYASGLG